MKMKMLAKPKISEMKYLQGAVERETNTNDETNATRQEKETLPECEP